MLNEACKLSLSALESLLKALRGIAGAKLSVRSLENFTCKTPCQAVDGLTSSLDLEHCQLRGKQQF